MDSFLVLIKLSKHVVLSLMMAVDETIWKPESGSKSQKLGSKERCGVLCFVAAVVMASGISHKLLQLPVGILRWNG